MCLLRFLFLFFLSVSIAQNIREPENIILFIGDGMGINYVSLSVLSLDNNPFHKFTTVGLSNTTAADKLITDSAAGATAISTGYKTKNRYLALDSEGNPLITIFEIARTKDIATGIVVTSSVTHATPAAFYAHIDDRNKEYEIAAKLLDKDVNVIIGGGNVFFYPQFPQQQEQENQTLIEQFQLRGYTYFSQPDQLFASDTRGEKILALLEKDELPKASNRDYTLKQLVEVALKELSKNKNGFLLLIEGAQIDWAGHANDADYLISEMEDFNGAINAAFEFYENNPNTLIIVTADHETGGMAINSIDPNGKNPELGFTSTRHTAGLVGVFAHGPGEENFSGMYENHILGRKLINLIDKSIIFY